MSLRRLERLILLGALLLGASARSAALPFAGELSIELHGPAFTVLLAEPASGAVEVSASGVHLTGASLAAGAFPATPLLQSITYPFSSVFPIQGVALSASNGPGMFAEAAGGALGGTMPLHGVLKFCLFGPCSYAISNIEVPLSIIGQGGTVFATAPVNLTVRGAPWTTGTVQVGAVSAHGSARGPAALASSTAQLGGSLNLVTPIFISSNIGAVPILPSFAHVQLNLGGTAACANGIDDDGDGFTDFPADPGCVSAQDLSEQQIGVACDDGIDNDTDGNTDFPSDPGCADPGSTSEQPQCDDGIDNDQDGAIDTADSSCPARSRPYEGPDCDDGVDNDGDGLTDLADPNCRNAQDRSEIADCSDGLDDWEFPNELIDYPAEPGCTSPSDPSEQADCGDRLDNDGDGRVDMEDLGCDSVLDPDETDPVCLKNPDVVATLTLLRERGRYSRPNGVSADGAVVVGSVESDVGAFRWTAAGGIVGIGPGEAFAASADGSVVVGTAGDRAFRWTQAEGQVDLGVIAGDTHSSAYGVSADGSVVGGESGNIATRWTSATGMTRLSSAFSVAQAVSASGTAIAGRDGNRAFHWTPFTGLVRLGVLPGALPYLIDGSRADGISADGEVVVGRSITTLGNGSSEAFRWTAAQGMRGLGAFAGPNGPMGSWANATSADGAVVVGGAQASVYENRALLWDTTNGLRSLDQLLETLCVGVYDGRNRFRVWEATGVSADGRTIVGFGGYGPADFRQGWIATIPDPTIPVCANGIDDDADGLLDLDDPGCASANATRENPECSDGIDNDADTFVDYPADPGCTSPSGPSEAPQCSNGIDDDGDGFVDFPSDPGCESAAGLREYAMCQDGIDNEGDGTIDFDGGATLHGGVAVGPPDRQCVHSYDDREAPSCGLGAELVVALGALLRWRRRASRVQGAPVQ